MSAPTTEAAHEMGAKGAQSHDDAERLAFEAWMRGHCWALCAVWEDGGYRGTAEHGENICQKAMSTRRLWAAWRDRAALGAQPKPAPVLLTDDIERLRLLTFCGCGDQFSLHDPGTCGACVAGMTCKPAPVLLTDGEMEHIFRRPGGWLERYREIEAALLKKNGITT